MRIFNYIIIKPMECSPLFEFCHIDIAEKRQSSTIETQQKRIVTLPCSNGLNRSQSSREIHSTDL